MIRKVYKGYINVFEIDSPAEHSAESVADIKISFKTNGINPSDPIVLLRSCPMCTRYYIKTGHNSIVALKELIVEEPDIAWPTSVFATVKGHLLRSSGKCGCYEIIPQ